MVLWLLSIVGVIVGVLATENSMTDPEALLLLGVAIIGVAIRLQRGPHRRG